MQLSRDQERFIAVYLRDVALRMNSGADDARGQRALELLDKRIRETLAGRVSGEVMDSDVVRVLDDMGPAAAQAEAISATGAPAAAGGGVREPGRDVVWLGVCAEWAEQLGVPVQGLRALCVAAGLFTGPLAVSLYIAAYAARWWTLPKAARPAIDWPRMAWNTVTALIIAIVLARACSLFLWAVDTGYSRAFGEVLPPVGSWGWIKGSASGYYTLAVLCALPLAVLSALPLAHGWDFSIKRLYLAILTIYGVMLSYGAASYVVGIALSLAGQYGGVSLSDLLEFLPRSPGG